MPFTPQQLMSGYIQGIFPMANDDGAIYWYDPDPRTILPLDNRFHIPRRLARTVRQGKFEIRIDYDFRLVMEYCAEREKTWISPELIDLYTTLHRSGFAHSVETWRNGQLVGGLYGVAINGLFAGESMFSLERDASKVALVHLVSRLRRRSYLLLDVQFSTAHLSRFGALSIPRAEYHARLARALMRRTWFA
ncbi:MAG: leucyl/phenylalanyl-tRNA--protein transferase [Ardenticatenaceae bacterium]